MQTQQIEYHPMQQIEYRLLQILYALGAGIILCQLLEWNSLTSYLFYGTFLIVLVLWICSVWEGLDRYDLLMIFIVIFAFVNVILNGILSDAVFSFQYMKKYIMFCCTMIYFSVSIKLKPGMKLFRFLEKIYMAVGLVLIIFYLMKNTQMHLLNGIYTNYLIFRFTNPNMTAMFLICMMMFSLAAMLIEKKWFYRIVFLVFAVIESYFVIQTQSRNTILITCIFVAAFLILLFSRYGELRLKKWVIALICIFPLIFVLIYLRLNSTDVVETYLGFLVSEGKGLDSRTKIWETALNCFRQSPVLGAYYQISDGTGTSQMHNSHLDIMASYGTGVFLLVCIFLFQMLVQMQTWCKKRAQSVCSLGFICGLLLGIGEAALFSGGLGFYLYVGVFPLLSKNMEEG